MHPFIESKSLQGKLLYDITEFLLTASSSARHQLMESITDHVGDAKTREEIKLFLAAWAALYTTIGALDGLQDDDTTSYIPRTYQNPKIQYHLVFTSYVVSTSYIPVCDKSNDLRDLWCHCVLRMANGQYNDLTTHTEVTFDIYELCVSEKTGMLFELALGGIAILMDYDSAHVFSFRRIGNMLGRLIQFADDISDVEEDGALNFARVLAYSKLSNTGLSAYSTEQFFSIVYDIYITEINKIAGDMQLDAEITEYINRLVKGLV